jgi:uncharacterized protein YigE (DUF2233 family)
VRCFGVLAAICLSWAAPALAVECETRQFEQSWYTICEVNAAKEEIRLFLRNDDGEILGHFSSVQNSLPPGKALVFAMNAGMYHPDRRPVGLYLENAKKEARLYPNPGPGNFGMVPNGVFCIRPNRADVIESLKYQANPVDCTYASQSGPMLVIDGKLHPKFIATSTSKFIRNGVGSSADGQRVVFVKSESAVNFHEFARLFRDELKTPHALYFDGKISRLHAPQLGRSDGGFWLGPIVGVVQ